MVPIFTYDLLIETRFVCSFSKCLYNRFSPKSDSYPFSGSDKYPSPFLVFGSEK